jgi:hypothetical protein
VDYQVLFNVAVLVSGFLGGWVLNSIYKSIERLDTDVRAMPQLYIAKEDYRQDLARIEHMLERIFNKLDGKVDR